jgi:hypothetical protein
MKSLVFDISNLLYRTFFVQKEESDETLAGLATHSALVMLNKYFRQFKPDRVVMAFDRKSWRKAYTASDKCISKKPYKGNRRQDMTPSQQIKYQKFIEHMKEFEALIGSHTTIITLVEDDLEADDLIAGYCELCQDETEHEVIVISTDSDLLQLLRYPSVRIVSPATDKPQVLSDFDGDPEFYVFTKCLRGDPTDNVQSAYPGVRSTRIKKAYDDPFERVQLMKTTWTNQDKIEFTVQQLFEENQILIDLTKQPEDIRELIKYSVAASVAKQRKFSMFHILRFIGKYKLVKIKESLDQYIPMLSC